MKRALPLVLAALCAVGLPVSLYWIFYRAPLEVVPPGAALYYNQKIVYWHVPSAILLFVAVFVCGITSVAYLVRRNLRFDDVALAAGELSVLFGLIVLVTGSIWARAAWGKWWVWDARLTSCLILWLTMLGYMLVRKYAGSGSERLAAGLAIFATVNIPLVYFSVSIWRTLHPPRSTAPSMTGDMARALLLGWLVFTLLFVTLLITRVAVVRADRRLHEARERALDAGLIE